MITEKEIASFLKEFKEKMKIWEILFRDDRNFDCATFDCAQAPQLPIDRKMTLERLVVQDYSEGPLEEKLYGGSDMWVFGKQIKTKEVYIKISLGAHGSSVICISFHIAEHTMNYPLK